MALQDFLGNFDVKSTSGTNFGIGTTVVIVREGASTDQVNVTFKTTVSTMPEQTVEMDYDAATDSLLAVDPDANTQLMSISQFVDPKGTGWKSIYGVVVLRDGSTTSMRRLPSMGRLPSMRPLPSMRRLPAWSAVPIGQSEDPNSVDLSGFVGTYVVKNTSDVQFGVGSLIKIFPQLDKSLGLEIIDPMGVTLLSTTLAYDASTRSVSAFASPQLVTAEGDGMLPVTVTLSVQPSVGTKVIYGTCILGDPHQGGTFAGEEEAP